MKAHPSETELDNKRSAVPSPVPSVYVELWVEDLLLLVCKVQISPFTFAGRGFVKLPAESSSGMKTGRQSKKVRQIIPGEDGVKARVESSPKWKDIIDAVKSASGTIKLVV